MEEISSSEGEVQPDSNASSQHDEIIKKAVRATRVEGAGIWFLGGVMCAVGFAGGAGAVVMLETATIIAAMLGVAGVLFLALGLFTCSIAYDTRSAPTELNEVLRQRPQSIRLIQRTIVKKTIEHAIEVRRDMEIAIVCDDNKRYGVELTIEDGEAFVEMLRKLAPNATIR